MGEIGIYVGYAKDFTYLKEYEVEQYVSINDPVYGNTWSVTDDESRRRIEGKQFFYLKKMNMQQAFEWISKIIDTCHNEFHFDSIDRLIILFHEKFNDENLKLELENLRNIKWNEIHNIIL
jgi:hypothetical protein